jgi:hypothetical protein
LQYVHSLFFPPVCPWPNTRVVVLYQSVGNLCTLVLVAIADTLLRPDHALPSLAAIIGSTMIVSAFAVLVVGMLAESSGSSDLKAGGVDA